MRTTSVSTSTLTFLSMDPQTAGAREIVERHQGFIVTEPGADDGLAVFRMASKALAAAADIQRSAEDEQVRPRIAVHTGDAVLDEQGYHGDVLERVRRLRRSCSPGQTVVSGTTVLLAAGSLPAGCNLVEAGTTGTDEQVAICLLQLGTADILGGLEIP